MRNYKLLQFIISITGCLCLYNCSDATHPDAYGYFEAFEKVISAEGSGRILSLQAKEGDSVEKDKLIGYIDTMQLYLQRTHLERQKEILKATLPNEVHQLNILKEAKQALEKERSRLLPLIEHGSVSRKKIDALDDEISVYEKKLQATKYNLKRESSSVLVQIETVDMQLALLNHQLSNHRIVSPEKGILQQLYAKENEFIATGYPLYKLSNMDLMICHAWFREDQLAQLAIGQQVKTGIDTNKSILYYTGTVQYIANQPEFVPNKVQTRDNRAQQLYLVKIHVKNDGRIKPGMPTEVTLIKSEAN